MRHLILAPAIVLSSCQHRLDDVKMVANTISPPAAYTTGDKEPYVRNWTDCHAYRDAAVELGKDVVWDGRTAIKGRSLAIHISEGSKIENTTAHPQYFNLWIQIPQDLKIGQPYQIRSAAEHRTISRRQRWESGDISDYSLLQDGEMTVSGMQGYDVPHLAPGRKTAATLTLTERSRDALRFSLRGTLPILQDEGRRSSRYNLIIDREFSATNKPTDDE